MKRRWIEPNPALMRLNLPTLGMVAMLVLQFAALGGLLWMAAAERHRDARVAEVVGLARGVEGFARALAVLDTERHEALQTAVAGFNRNGIFESVRGVTADGVIMCSTQREEVGTTHWRGAALAESWPTQAVQIWEHRGDPFLERVTFRSPVPSPAGQRWMVEGVVTAGTLQAVGAGVSGWMMVIAAAAVVLFGTLALFLQRRMSALGRIGSGLLRHRSDLEHEIGALRLASEHGAVAEAWNQLVGLCEELRDAAGRNTAYEELTTALQRSASNEFLEAANVIPEGIVHIVRGERLQYVNSMAARLLDLPPADEDDNPAGRNLTLDDIPAEAMAERFAEAIRAAWDVDHFEARTSRIEGGNDTTFRLRVLPVVRRKRGADAIVIISDISQAARAEKARDAFVNQVTHELRTPLTNIRAYTETMNSFDDPQIQKECYNVIGKETRRLSRLVEEMLSRSQIDLGTMQIRCNDVDLLELLQEAVRDLRATAEAKGIELNAQLPSKMPKLHADRDKLAVVINNLLGNALKYTTSGGRVSTSCQLANEYVEIRIQDSGIGISTEHHEKIFEPLYRVDREEVRNEVGSGVGLSTAREIIRQHGGDITVDSADGQGSEFTVRMPLQAKVLGEKAALL